MGQARRACRFCGGYGTSREHIIATWIGRAFEVPPVAGIEFVYRHVSENPEAGISRREKQAKAPAFYSRAFCLTCNTGWMAKLEEDVGPVLEPLLRGRPRSLSRSDQRLLAFWTIKTVLAFQSVEEPVTTFARPEDFANLFRLQGPLPNTQVWLGANDHGEPAWYRAHSFYLQDSTRQALDGFGATLTVGYATFYVLHGFNGRVGTRLRYPPALAFNEIWPDRHEAILWPPRPRLQAHQRQGLAEYLAGHSVVVGD